VEDVESEALSAVALDELYDLLGDLTDDQLVCASQSRNPPSRPSCRLWLTISRLLPTR